MTVKIKLFSAGIRRVRKPRRARAGLTLIELVLATGLLTVVLLYTLMALLSLIRLNRVTALEITATNAMRSQIEEVMTVARDNVGHNDISNQARAVIYYYGTNFDDEKIALGPKKANIDRVDLAGDGKTLTYFFGVPEPGQAARVAGGGDAEVQAMSPLGVGKMVIYLDEQSVPPADATWSMMWKDLGDERKKVTSGFDMNRDGHIDNRRIDGDEREKITADLLRDSSKFDEAVDIVQAPIDITVTYYANDSHEGEELQVTRRVIVM